jgi:hypothetical protein
MHSHGTGFIIIQRYMRTRNIYLDTYHVSTANIPVGQVDGKRLLLPSTLATWRSRLATPTLLLVSLKKRLRYSPTTKFTRILFPNRYRYRNCYKQTRERLRFLFLFRVTFSGYGFSFWFTVSVLRFFSCFCNDSVSAAVTFFAGCGPWRLKRNKIFFSN